MIEVLVGMVASGKSTYATSRAAQGALVVSEDATVLLVHGGLYKQYDQRLKSLYKAIELQIVIMGVALKRDVVIDRVNGTLKTRARWVALAHSLDQQVKAVVFPFSTPEEHADRRVQADSRGYNFHEWREVIVRHLDEYQGVDSGEGFDLVEYKT